MTAPEITIPREALEEAEKAVIEALDPGYPASPGFIARAACLAMLAAWPGMRVSMLFPPDVLHVVLPLTKEGA